MTAPMPMPVKVRKTRKPLSETAPDVILLVLGIAGLVLSGWSLGTLMHGEAHAPWPVAIFAVAVFDLVALASGVLVYTRRSDPWSAVGARIAMTLALVASSVVNGAHGYALGGWTTAAVLAAAPLAFEIVFELRHRTLTALVWVLFRKEAMARLRFDAWTRIAPQDPAPDASRIVEVKGATVEELASKIRELERANTREQIANTEANTEFARSVADTELAPATSANTVFGFAANTPNMAELVREQIANTTENTAAVAAVMAIIPNANRASVAAAVRRERARQGS